MTGPQIALLALLVAMLAAFAQPRFRIELVAITGLAVAYLLALVPAEAVFAGFASPTVITVLEILLVVEVLKGSHVIEAIGARIGGGLISERRLILALCALGAFLSVFMNNIGALALVMPLAASICDRHDVPLARVLMPLSFATLLGGLCSVVGTPANLIASDIIAELRGTPLGYFELAIVGGPLALLGLAYFGATSGPFRASRTRTTRATGARKRYLIEALVPEGSPLTAQSSAEITIHGLVRNGTYHGAEALPAIAAMDLLLFEADLQAFDDLVARNLVVPPPTLDPEARRVEAVIMPDSIFIGSRITDLEPLFERDIRVDAVSASARTPGPLSEQRLRIGDVLVLRGTPESLDQELEDCGLAPILPSPAMAPTKANWLPVALFGLGVALTALVAVPPEIAFGLVVVALALTGNLSLRRGLETMNWPILIMLGAMIPLGEAVATTGLADSIADAVAAVVPVANTPALIACMLGLSVLLTPFVNNPSTVLVLAPIGIEFARQYGVPAEPVVIAIAIGASLDFLTPFGHHNNTLVMGVANYRFSDFFRYGLPLLLITGIAAFLAISLAFAR